MRRAELSLSRLFRWWLTELESLIPAAWRGHFRRKADCLIFNVTEKAIHAYRMRDGIETDLGIIKRKPAEIEKDDGSVSAWLAGLNTESARVVLRLPGSCGLRPVLELPQAADEELRKILDIEMDRQTPFRADQVYYDYEIIGRVPGAKRLTVRLTVAPKHIVDEAVELVSAGGMQPDIVDLAGEDRGSVPAINLLGHANDTYEPRALNKLNLSLAGLGLLLAVAAIGIPIWKKNAMVEALASQLAEARQNGNAARLLEERIGTSVAEASYLVNRKRRTPSAVAIIDELSRVVPDGTWLHRIELHGNSVRIYAYSPQASDLIGIIQDSPLFDDARFDSEVEQDRSMGVDRLQISARILERAEE